MDNKEGVIPGSSLTYVANVKDVGMGSYCRNQM